MTVNQLKRFIRFLPESFLKEMKDRDFTTCWYASSGLDKRPMELLDYSHPDALTDEKVDVFFYTDIDFTFSNGEFYFDATKVDFENGIHRGYQDGIKPGLPDLPLSAFQKSIKDFVYENFILNADFDQSLNRKYEAKLFTNEVIEAHRKENWNNKGEIINNSPIREKLLTDLGFQTGYILTHGNPSYQIYIENYEPSVVLVKHQREDGTPFYTFYLEIDDITFESILIEKKLKVDFAAHWGGHAGPGPRLLGNLGCKYFLGAFGGTNELELQEDGYDYRPFQLSQSTQFEWNSVPRDMCTVTSI
jgi:hypothetical protein